MKQLLQKTIEYGLIATLIVFPLSIAIALASPEDPGHPIISINFSIGDIVIGITFLLWALKVLIFKEWKSIKLPPTPILVFVAVGILSFLNSQALVQWLKEVIQMIEYMLIFYVLLLNNMQHIRIARLKNILFISTTILLLLSLIQHSFLDANVYLVRGLFENRNILGTFLCLVLPIVYIDLIYSPNLLRKIWMGSLLACSYVVTVSGSAVLSLVIGLLIVSILINKKTAIKYGLSILLLGILYPFILPSKNSAALTEFASIYEQGSISHNYRRILTILGDLDRFTFVNKSIGKNSLKISSDVYLSGKMPPIREGEGFKDMDGKTHVKNRYLEMQASLNLLSENFLLGVGLGNFQNVIGTYYRELPKVNTKEPNQHNGYLIIAATTGILGLAAFVWIFIYLFSLNYKKLRTSIDLPDKMIYLGLMGSVVAIMIESCFSYIFAASLLVPFIFINYLSVRNITETNDL